MDNRVSSYFKGIIGKRVAFCGIGRSNLPLALMFKQKGAIVYACDQKPREQLGDAADEMEKKGIILKCGKNYLDDLDVDIIFRAPGMYWFNEKLQAFRKKGVVVTSEIETFFDLCPCKIYAITGTDGKTTTTTIVTNILEKSGKTVHKGGNIGIPLLPIIETIEPNDVAVVELSSFQLISMRKSPDTAAVTNIYPDHLNVHKDMQEYIDAKKNILLHQNAYSRTVLNADNELSSSLSEIVRGNLYMFSVKSKVERGSFLDNDDWLCFTDGKTVEKIVHKDDIRIPGMHNVENYLAAISIVHGDVENDAIEQTAKTFGGVEHRIELVRELEGVKYYNDSIATSPASVSAGLNAFQQKMIIIAGGSAKGLDYNELAEQLNLHVKILILLGETANEIETAVKNYKNYSPDSIKIIRVKTMDEAVKTAYDNARSGDIVSLSPASASFDMYKDFEARGVHFKQLVNSL